jgi:nucleoside-diphosphate-sugar epimerase
MTSAIPRDSLVLVTGINGYLGSHIADQILQAGFRVRGTTRILSRAAPLKKLWDDRYGPDKVELVVVEDMAVPGAFDEAVQGQSLYFSLHIRI